MAGLYGVASNGSELTRRELGIVRDYVTLNFDDICALWRETSHGDLSFLK